MCGFGYSLQKRFLELAIVSAKEVSLGKKVATVTRFRAALL